MTNSLYYCHTAVQSSSVPSCKTGLQECMPIERGAKVQHNVVTGVGDY